MPALRHLELLAHKVGVAVRICQHNVGRSDGRAAFATVFAAFDAAISAGKQLLGDNANGSTPRASSEASAGSIVADQANNCTDIAGHSF